MAETEEKTHITKACRDAMITHGVLMKRLPDGTQVPAGMELMTKPVLRVALVEADQNGAFPEGFVNETIQSLFPSTLRLGNERNSSKPGTFEKGIEQKTRDAIGFWRTGAIEFVDFRNNPDITIFAVNSYVGSLATFPLNNHPDPLNTGQSEAYIVISSSRIEGETDEHLIRHEFGHSIGVFHPVDAIREAAQADPPECKDEYIKESMGITDIQRDEFGIMGYGKPKESSYDRGTRDFVRTGIPPKPDNTIKP